MKKIKRIVSLVLLAALMLTLAVPGMAQDAIQDVARSQPVTLSSTVPEEIADLATAYLKEAKETMCNAAPAMGFDLAEFLGLAVGTPFTVYGFAEDGTLTSDDTYCCPLLYQGRVSATILMRYLPQAQQYTYTFGKVYADALNSIQHCQSVDTRQNLAVGAMNGVLFVTDGQKAEPIFYENAEAKENFRAQKLQAASATMYAQVDKTSVAMTEVIATPKAEKTRTSRRAASAYPNPLPVPHIYQDTGYICGVCSWAAVLNYRFGAKYTYASLEREMINGGYFNGTSKDNRAIPTMSDYYNHGVAKYSTDFIYRKTPISFTDLRTSIDGGKPIFGDWVDRTYSPGIPIAHAVVITGYQAMGSYHNYYLKNPWYSNMEVIRVSDPKNAVYQAGGYAFVLEAEIY